MKKVLIIGAGGSLAKYVIGALKELDKVEVTKKCNYLLKVIAFLF